MRRVSGIVLLLGASVALTGCVTTRELDGFADPVPARVGQPPVFHPAPTAVGLTPRDRVPIYGYVARQAELKRGRAAFRETIPTCSAKEECDRKWQAALEWLRSDARLPIAAVFDDVIETRPNGYRDGGLSVRIVKILLPQGLYQIRITPRCLTNPIEAFNNYVLEGGMTVTYCDAMAYALAQGFNNALNGVSAAAELNTDETAPWVPMFCREPGDVWNSATGCHRGSTIAP